MTLREKLLEYRKIKKHPFHMPGHKRKEGYLPNPYEIDITEIHGFDELHSCDGILFEEKKKVQNLYETKESFILVNGSTVGNLAGILGITRPNEKILIARNCHKSIYHGAMLMKLQVEYLQPEIDKTLGFAKEITVEEVKKKLEEHKDAKAVILTSPTYEGICSDIKSIATICHEKKIPLMVDAAHGAHIPFLKGEESKNPIRQGADVVIMSLHKTMPALTQTALLHISKELVSTEKIGKAIDMLETSSPSYVLMASVSECLEKLEKKELDFEKYTNSLKKLRVKLESLNYIKQVNLPNMEPSKIVLSLKNTPYRGDEFANILRKKYNIEIEMTSLYYVLLMTSVCDTDEDFDYLANALKKEDDLLKKEAIEASEHVNFQYFMEAEAKSMELWETMYAEKEWILLENSIGEISGENVVIYPPGIPTIVAGEKITKEKVEMIINAKKSNLKVIGLQEDSLFQPKICIIVKK